MKTANEWATHEQGFGFNFIDNIEPQERTFAGQYSFVDLIKRIQGDAYRQAMDDARKIVQKEIECVPSDRAIKVTTIEALIVAKYSKEF